MIQSQVETLRLAQCPNGHSAYFPYPEAKHCYRCGGPVELRDVKVTVNSGSMGGVDTPPALAVG